MQSWDNLPAALTDSGAEHAQAASGTPVQLPLSIEAGDGQRARKARGAFFTPARLCDYLVEWAVRSPRDTVLEPSCGEAAFLLSAAQRLSALGASPRSCARQLNGVELHSHSARAARALLRARGFDGRVAIADFFTLSATSQYDVVIGNPPYVRYQGFSGEARARARSAALRAGVELTGLASSWAAFTVHASLFLKPGGRLGLVLPAELLSVNYAAEVRRFLMRRFTQVRLVLFTERVFPDVQEKVVLLMAEGDGPTDHYEVYQAHDVSSLGANGGVGRRIKPVRPTDKWVASLVPQGAFAAYTQVAASGAFAELREWGETTLGIVTGNNRFFTLSPAKAASLGLVDGDVVPLSPPGSRHLRLLALTESAWRQLGKDGRQTLLFRPAAQPSRAAQDYIEVGERLGVHEAYKCRVRSPWWRVPLTPAADLFVTYMNADTPRLCANDARAHHLNSVHGLYLRPELRRLGVSTLPLGALNSLTLMGAELVGRAYGGGILKLEPREADVLPVPAPSTLAAVAEDLAERHDKVLGALLDAHLLDAVRLVDDVLLLGHLGLGSRDVALLREARAELVGRRLTRGSQRENEFRVNKLGRRGSQGEEFHV